MLKTLGAAGALFGVSSVGSASGKSGDKDGHDGFDDDKEAEDEDGDGIPDASNPSEHEEDVGQEASVRFDSQVTDGSYVVANDVVVPTAGFLSIHQLDDALAVDGEEVYYIDREDGSPQFAAQTIIGGSDLLEPGVYDRVPVDIYADDRRPLVEERGIDRLDDPKPLLALMHVDGNDSGEFELFDNDDIEDTAYDFGETDFAPPFDRPSDIAALVPIGDDDLAEQFDIFVERGEIEESD
jgi:hypothetical protein